MPWLGAKPSISTSSWFSVCSRSSWLSELPPRLRPTASSSSMKMMHDGWRRASLNSLRIREAPTPAYISTKSEPLANRNGTLASPAIDRASSVLPVPGGPTSSTPFGMRPPIASNRPGSRRKSTISLTSSLASSTPATSAKVTVVRFGVGLARLALERRDAARGDAIHHEPERADEPKPEQQRDVAVRRLLRHRLHVDAHLPLRHVGHERRVGGHVAGRRRRPERLTVGEGEVEAVAVDDDRRDRAAVEVPQQVGERHLARDGGAMQRAGR